MLTCCLGLGRYGQAASSYVNSTMLGSKTRILQLLETINNDMYVHNAHDVATNWLGKQKKIWCKSLDNRSCKSPAVSLQLLTSAIGKYKPYNMSSMASYDISFITPLSGQRVSIKIDSSLKTCLSESYKGSEVQRLSQRRAEYVLYSYTGAAGRKM